jgi:hypothetical protein
MKESYSIWTFETFLRFVLFVGFFVLCKGQQEEDSSVAAMKKEEQEALYSAIQGFVGDSWNGSDLYPDPCGWTPIQVLIQLLINKLIKNNCSFFFFTPFSKIPVSFLVLGLIFEMITTVYIYI